MIAQRLQIETLRVLTKVVERNSSGYVMFLTAGGQCEIHPGSTVSFDRCLYVEHRERYFLARITV